MSEQLFIRLRGRIQGPFTSDQLQSLAKRGQFSRTHEVSVDGVQWSRASNRPELFPAAVVDLPPVELDFAEAQFAVDAPPTGAAVPPPTDVWHYNQLGKNYGPVDFSHLQYLANSGQIRSEDMVWKEGLPEWLEAGRVPGLIKNPAAEHGQTPVYFGAVAAPFSATSEFPRVSALAVTSFILSLLWLCGVGSLLAVIFGAVALHQIRLGRGRIRGTGLAISGLSIGIVSLVASFAALLVIVGPKIPSVSRSTQEAWNQMRATETELVESLEGVQERSARYASINCAGVDPELATHLQNCANVFADLSHLFKEYKDQVSQIEATEEERSKAIATIARFAGHEARPQNPNSGEFAALLASAFSNAARQAQLDTVNSKFSPQFEAIQSRKRELQLERKHLAVELKRRHGLSFD